MARNRIPLSPPARKWLLAGCAITLLLTCGVFADYWTAYPEGVQATYVGRSACVDCHREQAEAYAGSHHDLAMDIATETTVLADFDDATLEHDGIVSRMYRDGDRFMVQTEGEDGELEDFEVKYVFGVEPLQQYMVEFDRDDDLKENELPRLQVLRISWDTVENKWFYLRPPDVDDKLEPDDPLHWTGIAQRWQTMCAECHSTHLVKNYDDRTGRYHTTFSEIDVSCEACHGPGSLHVELAESRSLFWDRRIGYALAKLKGEDPEPQLQTCAACHSRRGILNESFLPGEPLCDHFNLELLRDDTYFADGQIKDEVYVYGSFIQSRMYHKGIRCTDCHDPHSLKLKHPGNETCTSCHQHSAGKYDVPSHHHHPVGKPGSMCVDCHMPVRTYMDVDPRRDHSLRVPRPDLSVELGTPNACTGCHLADRLDSVPAAERDQLKEYADWQRAAEQGDVEIQQIIAEVDLWCDQACQTWYGDSRQTPDHFAEPITRFRRREPGAGDALARLAVQSNDRVPAIVRSTALAELAESGDPSGLEVAKQLLKDPELDPLVRAAAIPSFMNERDSNRIRKALMPLLEDPSRLVRSEAARLLVMSGAYQQLRGTEQARIDQTLEELRETIDYASDRASSHMSWALLCEARGRINEAVESYQTAMRVEPTTTGPRSNLASLLERVAQQSQGPQAIELQQQVTRLRAEELPLLGRDAALAPDNASLQYRYGLALYLDGQLDRALELLQRAVELEPETPDFRTARDLLKQKIDGQ